MENLKKKAKSLEPMIRIGKKGLTDEIIAEIKKAMKKRELIKIKLLRSFIEDKDKKAIAVQIAGLTGTIIVDAVGNTVTICKKYKSTNT